MKDVEYIKNLLKSDYQTERSNEITHPPLDHVIRSTSFDYLKGTVQGEVPNGETSRDGNPYLWFKFADKSILSHRFISAVTIDKWVPRECDIDHINHNPSDNRPANLRITTPRDNAGNRRRALISELIDIGDVEAKLLKIKSLPVVEPVPEIDLSTESDGGLDTRRLGHTGPLKYSGDTTPGTYSGTYFGTTFGSWHWYPAGTAPDVEDFVENL